MGADEAIQITDPALEGSDLFGIAKALAAYFKGKPFDLILAGRQAMDDDAGIVGPAVAELLGIPHVHAIVGLEVDAAEERGQGRPGGGERQGDPLLPASGSLYLPKGAKHTPYSSGDERDEGDEGPDQEDRPCVLGLSGAEVGGQAAKMKVRKYFPPAKRPPVRMIKEDFPENVKTLVKLLREEAKVI